MMSMDDMIEAAALAAWKDYSGVPDVREDWMDDEWWHDAQEPVRQWHEWPAGCTHIGADGFRACARAALIAALPNGGGGNGEGG